MADLFVDKMADSSHNAFLIEDRRSYAGDQAAGFEVALAKHRHCCMVGVGCLLWLGFLQMVEGIELHDRPGQLLGQPVMDFVGDELPFVIAGLQKVLEVAVLLRQCLLGLSSAR